MDTNNKGSITPPAKSGDAIKPGDVRLINGVPSLVITSWMSGDNGEVLSWIVCPCKGFSCTDNTGHLMPAGTGKFFALPLLGASMTPKFIGELVAESTEFEVKNNRAGWTSTFGGKPPSWIQWSFENKHSSEDMALAHKMCAPEDVEEMLADEAEEAKQERLDAFNKVLETLKNAREVTMHFFREFWELGRVGDKEDALKLANSIQDAVKLMEDSIKLGLEE